MDKIKATYAVASEKERKQFGTLWGVLAMSAAGMEPACSKNTREKYRKVGRTLGLTEADFVTPDRSSLRLDYDSGRVIDGET